MSGMHRVLFRKENVTCDVPTGTNLRKSCMEYGIDPYPVLGGLISCRGKGFCGTCMVTVDDTAGLAPPAKREAKFLKKAAGQFAPEVVDRLRLSCHAEVVGDVIIDTDPDVKPGWKTHGFYSGKPSRTWTLPE